jgi:hypothetical protein
LEKEANLEELITYEKAGKSNEKEQTGPFPQTLSTTAEIHVGGFVDWITHNWNCGFTVKEHDR